MPLPRYAPRFAPEPWLFDLDEGAAKAARIRRDCAPSALAMVYNAESPEGLANVRLITLAPELFWAVDGLLQVISEIEVDGTDLSAEQLEQVRKAEALVETALGND